MSVLRIMAATTLLLVTQYGNVVASENFSIHPAGTDESWFVYNNVQPGATINDAITAINPLSKSIKLSLYALDAKILNDGGFAPAAQEVRQRTIGAWLTLKTNTAKITAKKTQTIPFTLHIPTTVTPARYIGVILATEIPTAQESGAENSYESESNVSIRTRVGVRVYVNIAGAPAIGNGRSIGQNKEATIETARATQQATTNKQTVKRKEQQSIATTTIAVATSTAKEVVGGVQQYIIQLGQFVINHKRNVIWIIVLIVIVLLFFAWRKER